MAEIQVFLSYDLTFNSDYDGLFKWLDNHNAENCGQNFCEFAYKFNSDKLPKQDKNASINSLFSMINDDISKNVKLNNGDRIFVVSSYDNTMFGGFLTGSYAPKPWAGYGDVVRQKPKVKIFQR